MANVVNSNVVQQEIAPYGRTTDWDFSAYLAENRGE